MAASKEGIARARQILENDRREINKVEEHYAGGGCKNCPAKKVCGGTYRGSVCSAMRYKHGVDFDPLTHAEQIRKMNDAQLADFNRMVSIGGEPWCDHHCKMNGDGNCNNCLDKWLGRSVAQPEDDGKRGEGKDADNRESDPGSGAQDHDSW